VDASLVDSGLMLMAHQILNLAATGRPPQRTGTAFAMSAPYEAFDTADGQVMLAAGNDALYARVCTALGVPELIEDSRFVHVTGRVEHRAALHEALEARTRTLTSQQAEEVLRRHEVPVSPVNRLDATLEHPLAQERDMVVPADPLPHVRLPILPVVNGFERAPRLGEHTAEVLGELGIPVPEAS